MKKIDVLKINQFDAENLEGKFYSNIFSIHLNDFHKAITKPHKHDFFLTILFTKGKGFHEIDFDTYPITAGSIFMLQPGQTHHWEFTEEPEGFIFFHTQEFYELPFSKNAVFDLPFYSSSQTVPALTLSEQNTSKIAFYFEELNSEYKDKKPRYIDKCHSFIHLIYLELSRYYLQKENDLQKKSPVYFNQLRSLEQLIDTNFRNEKSPSVYAQKMNVSSKHLNRITQELIGKTTSELILERVILEAKRILVNSKDSLTNIAYSLGYEDYAYFSRVFKTKTGETPSKFSKKYL